MRNGSVLLGVMLLVGMLAGGTSRAQVEPPALPQTPGLSVLQDLRASRIEDAVRKADGLAATDPLSAWARASVAFHQGDYSRAAEALPEPGVSPEIEARLGYLRGNILGAVAATEGMLERTEGNFRFRFAPTADAILVDYALDALEGQRTYMGRLLGEVPPGPTLVELMPDKESFLAASGLPPEWVDTTNTVAISKWDRLIVLSPMNMARGYSWKDTLAHEYVHYALSRASGDRLPIWFQEGSAKVLENRWRSPKSDDWLGPRSETLLARALREDTLIPFADMHPSMAALPSAQDAALAFAEVATAVDFLLDTGGPDAYRQVVSETRLHGDAMRAATGALGPAAGGFEGRWRRHLKEQQFQERVEIADLRQTIVDGAAGRGDDGGGMDGVLKEDRRMQDHARVGDLLRTRSRNAAALIEYRRAEDAGRFHSPELANKIARTLHALGRLDDAEGTLRETIAMYPEYTPTVSLLARVAYDRGDAREVRTWAARAIALNPFDPNVHHVLREAHRVLGDEAGVAHEERVLQILGDHLGRRAQRLAPITTNTADVEVGEETPSP